MPVNLDFNSILADLTTFQQQVGKIHSELTNPKQKAALGAALQKVAEARADVEVNYPKAIKTIEESAARSQARSKAGLEKVAALREKLAALKNRPPAAPPKKEPPKFDGQLGARLSSELLSRFADRAPSLPDDDGDDREIWEDWSWNQTDPQM